MDKCPDCDGHVRLINKLYKCDVCSTFHYE
jgi:hypothetical protein